MQLYRATGACLEAALARVRLSDMYDVRQLAKPALPPLPVAPNTPHRP